MLLSELSNLIRNHLHLKVPTEVGVSDIPRSINDVPKYLVLKSLKDVNVALFRATLQLYAVGFSICSYSISLLYIDRAHLPMSQYTSLYYRPSSSRFFLTCVFQRSLASSVKPRYFAVFK